jgi:hypothetical protein
MWLQSETWPQFSYSGPSTLEAMYESSELFNEGLLSFEYPIYRASDEELDHFLGGLIRSAGRAVSGVARTISRSPIGRTIGGAATTIGRAVSAVNKVVPVSMLTNAITRTPLGMAFRAGLGAVQAAAEGRNVFQGAVRSLAPDMATRFFVDAAMAATRGEDNLKAAQKAAQAGIGDLRKSLQFARDGGAFRAGNRHRSSGSVGRGERLGGRAAHYRCAHRGSA